MLVFPLLICGPSTFMIFWSRGNILQKVNFCVVLKLLSIKNTFKLSERLIIKLWILFFSLVYLLSY